MQEHRARSSSSHLRPKPKYTTLQSLASHYAAMHRASHIRLGSGRQRGADVNEQ
jgi:hypothetical protein